jgi:hypothetical protein
MACPGIEGKTMAWKVYGFMHPVDSGKKNVQMHGPLPMKRWVKSPSDRKPRKIKAELPKGNAADSRFRNEQAQIRKAAEYGLWLAKRDGYPLPQGAIGVPQFTTIDVNGKPEKRCMSVLIKGPVKMEVRDARRKLISQEVMQDLTRVEIPNWAWVPSMTETVAEIEPEPALPIAPTWEADVLAGVAADLAKPALPETIAPAVLYDPIYAALATAMRVLAHAA